MMKKAGLAIFIATLTLMLSLPVWAQSGRKSVQNQDSESVALKGEITNILKPLATFKAENGKEYTVHLGPVWYWNQEKMELKKGKAEMTGAQEEVDGALHLYPSKIIQGEVEIVLASDDGTPKWCPAQSGRSGMARGHHHHNCCGNCRRK